MEQEYLTVKQFAEAVGMTQQGIYKQFNNKLKDYIEIIDNKKMIKSDALRLYEISLNNSSTNNLTTDTQKLNNVVEQLNNEIKRLNNDLTTANNSLIDVKATLKGKEEVIKILHDDKADLNEKLKKADEEKAIKDNQIEKLQTLLDQEQQLHKQTKDQYQLLLVDKEEPPEHLQEQLTEQAEQIEKLKAELAEEKSKGFFKRLFKR